MDMQPPQQRDAQKNTMEQTSLQLARTTQTHPKAMRTTVEKHTTSFNPTTQHVKGPVNHSQHNLSRHLDTQPPQQRDTYKQILDGNSLQLARTTQTHLQAMRITLENTQQHSIQPRNTSKALCTVPNIELLKHNRHEHKSGRRKNHNTDTAQSSA